MKKCRKATRELAPNSVLWDVSKALTMATCFYAAMLT